MEYMTVKQAGEKWHMSVRSVQRLCKEGRIPGAQLWGRAWMIPDEARRPADNRQKTREKRTKTEGVPFPRQSPYLIMTDLYDTPGGADRSLAALAGDPEAHALFDAQLAYHRGEIDRAYSIAAHLPELTDNPTVRIGAGMMEAYCSMYNGDMSQWMDARDHILSARDAGEEQRELAEVSVAIVSSGIFEHTLFPEWFQRGRFDILPADSHPAVRYCYAQYLFSVCYEAVRKRSETPSPHDIFHTFPQICEILISQTRADGAILPEIYLCLLCAAGYHTIGEDDLATEHIDRAIELALPDRLYAPLAEKRSGLDFLLDERLELIDKAALNQVRALNKRLMEGWTALHNQVLDRSVCGDLTTNERQVAKLAAHGLTNQQISQRLHVSTSAVKQTMRTIMEKTGAVSRAEIAKYI
ncbi:MAG: LuxR C-terminal-related transcriptional regulator [Bacillota bacterium]|nr:LuxR C-terminal-related transcriptional regulator [Bacillota bacterium]